MSGFWERPIGSSSEVVIACPTVGIVSFNWALSTIGLAKPQSTAICGQIGLPFHVARNQLVRDAKQFGARFIWFIDTDVIPPVDAYARLKSLNLPIVSAFSYSKKGHPALWKSALDGTAYTPMKQDPGDKLMEIDAIPMGCCLIDMRVFDVIPEPWFDWTIENAGEDVPGHFSEDFEFCRKAQRYGFRIFVHTGIRCKHETLLALDPMGNP